MRTRVLIFLLGSLGVAACAVGPALAAHQGPPPRAHAARTSVVRFGEYFYRPKAITISAGDSVRFTNVGKIAHTVADSTRSGTVRSRVIHPRPLEHGQSQTVRFKRRGTIYYLCTFHPTLMRGKIVVR